MDLPIEQVQPGDRVRIRPGESIPVDGSVIEGRSGVNESLVTGESMPQEKATGDHVIGGSINQTGTLLVQVTTVGDEGFLQQVARQVEESRALKPGFLALVDRVLQVYVPAVLAIAGAALLVWTLGAWLVTGAPNWTRGIFAAPAVLVMGYPCALGMATPLAMIGGGGAAAEREILMRSAAAFHALKDVTQVVLDKTGTITCGVPAVVEVVALAGHDRQEVLGLAAAAEHASEHPLARALAAAAEAEGLDVSGARDFQSTTGKGVTATVSQHHVVVGSPQFLADNGIALGVPLAATGLLHPVWAMVAMAASVTTVLTNSFGGRLLPARRRGREVHLTLHIANMHCANCLAAIRESVGTLGGVDAVTGDPARQTVTVTYHEGTVEPDGIREAIVERGFQIA